MDKSLYDVLEGREANYLFPFFWMHGEEEEVLRNEVRRVYEAGISSVCLESRPHPDFAGPGWWRDVDIILDEAGKRDMKIWILDDYKFPTGYANGRIKDLHPRSGKIYLHERHMDAVGPMKDASFLVEKWLDEGDGLLAVIASKKTGIGDHVDETLLDITRKVYDGILYWDIPEGQWRVFIIFTGRKGGGRENYINPIDAESVKNLIDAVYKPHYRRYGSEFGKSILGFFSDEPEMGNSKGYNFNDSIGRKMMPLPWSGEMPALMSAALGEDFARYLPCLWFEAGSMTPVARYKYMDIITSLYEKNFTGQLAGWCHKHGLEYIGHIIEDDNSHARLGCSTGHYFRSLMGQDMAGIDVVSQQIMPGQDSPSHQWVMGGWDGEFFHYGLAKMASSLGHMDPAKKGRAMCEVYGAYGWMEGLKLMKWLSDHMLVRGVNKFVPHAFSPHEFPDPDCPPHFYAGGHNPQYRYYRLLNKYINRVSHLLSDGIHIAPAAILYHAEAEWSGDYMLFQKPVRELARAQIDCDVIPADLFSEGNRIRAYIRDGRMVVNNEEYECLIIPYSRYIPSTAARFIAEAQEREFKVIFIDKLPEGLCDSNDQVVCKKILKGLERCEVVPLEELAGHLVRMKIYDIRLSEYCPYFRYYHYYRNSTHYYMFFNEHPYNSVKADIYIPFSAENKVYIYDALEGSLGPACVKEQGTGMLYSLELSHYQSVILIIGEVDEQYILSGKMQIAPPDCSDIYTIDGIWKFYTATAAQYPDFSFRLETRKLFNVTSPAYDPGFAGTMRYETIFWLEKNEGGFLLDIENIYETAEVWINGVNVGSRICPPYRFDITGLVKKGENQLKIDVTNTLGMSQRDRHSKFSALEPSGLLGPVRIIMGCTGTGRRAGGR